MKNFNEYLENFKIILVKRYCWTVTDASKFNSSELKECFNEGLDEHHAYFKLFNIEQDLQST